MDTNFKLVTKKGKAISITENYEETYMEAITYSNLEILTARPSKSDHQKVEHLLYGYINGHERYNVTKWCNDISDIIDNKIIHSNFNSQASEKRRK